MTKEEYRGWRNSPLTNEIFVQIGNFREEMVEALTSGQTLGGDIAVKTAKTVGCVMALDYILKMEIEE